MRHQIVMEVKKPELHDIIPSTFRECKRVSIKCKEFRYESILIRNRYSESLWNKGRRFREVLYNKGGFLL